MVSVFLHNNDISLIPVYAALARQVPFDSPSHARADSVYSVLMATCKHSNFCPLNGVVPDLK